MGLRSALVLELVLGLRLRSASALVLELELELELDSDSDSQWVLESLLALQWASVSQSALELGLGWPSELETVLALESGPGSRYRWEWRLGLGWRSEWGWQ